MFVDEFAPRRGGWFVRRAILMIAALVCIVCLSMAASADAAPRWDAHVSWGPTNLSPGATGQLLVNVSNTGPDASQGLVTVVDKLPSGVSATGFGLASGWSCFGSSTVTCTTASVAEPLSDIGTPAVFLPRLIVDIKTGVSAASGTKTNMVSVSGGGAGGVASWEQPVTWSATAAGSGGLPYSAGFGVVPYSFDADVFDAAYPEGQRVRQAGSHPFELRVNFDYNLLSGTDPVHETLYTRPEQRVRDVDVTLPQGMLGNPEATPKCKPVDFLNEGAVVGESTGCPADTQVGYLTLDLGAGRSYGGFDGFAAVARSASNRVAVYNLEAPYGTPADFGFRVGAVVVGHIYATLDAAHDYAIEATSPFISALSDIRSVKFTMWGVPGDPAHDVFRSRDFSYYESGNEFGASFEAPIKPLLTLPADCGVDDGPLQISTDSWSAPEVFSPALGSAVWSPPSPPGNPNWSSTPTDFTPTGCEDQRVRFHPDVTLQPTTRDAGAPTGLQVDLENPQRDQTVTDPNELYAQNGSLHGIDTPPIKKTVVRLPEGMTVSTSAAQGLGNCSLAQIGLGTNNPVRCPDNSQYGTLTVHTPALPADQPMHGFIYIAKQNENPFNDFLALYMVIEEPARGLLVKIPAKIELDPVTGQIVTTFDDLPQFPISDVQLNLKSGVRAALVNPATCGVKTITAEFYSWSDPDTPVTETSSYDVTRKPDGTPCVNALAERPFAPQMTAGSVSPSAGDYSQFLFRLTRGDEDQELSRLDITLPEGLSANISAITQCPEAKITQATAPSRTGQEEIENPSCPASSQVGTVDVGSGVGVPLYYFSGKAYLAGPYEGAPLSLVVIVPAVAGPYDLGVTAVRSALFIDPLTSQARIVTDPFPQIYKGIPVRIRDIRVKVDRPETMFNPTSCSEKQITGRLTSSLAATASVASRFQAANCTGLAFHPVFTASTPGHTTRSGGAGLSVKLSYPKAPVGTQANIAQVKVELPKRLPSRLTTLQKACSDSVFDVNPAGCPAASVIAHARAVTPILPVPLSGPAYFVSHGGAAFPDLVVVLQGYGITIDLVGSTFISKSGITSTTFKSVPDVPVDTFELTLPQGPGSALAANGNLCTAKLRMPTTFTAQNGAVLRQKTKIAPTGCAKTKKVKKRRKAKNAGRRHHDNKAHNHSSRKGRR